MSTTRHDVIVVGLGAMGSAAAYHLARRGARVLGLDRFAPPHQRGSSHGQTRIIRRAYFEDPVYVPLVDRAYALWDALADEVGEALLLRTGGLMIGRPDGVLVGGALQSARQHGLAHEVLDADALRSRHPALQPDADMVGVFEPDAGVLFPEACIAAHLALARRRGAELRIDTEVSDWSSDADGVRVRTAVGEHHADQLLIAAGAWLPRLVPALADRFRVERQLLFWFDALGDAAPFAPARCPIHLWEWAPQRFFYGFPELGEGIKLAVHHEGETADPDAPRRAADTTEIAAIRALAERFVPAAAGRLRASASCLYTNSVDGHFRIDRLPDAPRVLVASPCSGHGFKFASAIGEGLASWLLSGQAPDAFASFAFHAG